MKSNSRARQQVRIIAGDWRGRKLPVLNIDGLRPTTDRVRETLFNWLMREVRGAQCLDLFAGSGALGFECLSRGADYVHFVEKNRKVAQCLQENIERLTSVNSDKAAVFSGSAAQFLQRSPSKSFDLVFIDPPFASDLIAQSASLLESQNLLSSSALIYIEQQSKAEDPLLPNNWQCIKRGKAGQSKQSLWQRFTPE